MPNLEPAFVLTYGKAGSGKSCDNLGSFPCALFIAGPGALKPAEGLFGYEPRVTDVKSIDEATELVTRVTSGNDQTYDAIVVDDFSLLADVSYVDFAKRYKGYASWNALIDSVLNFAMTARRCGLHVILNAHERPPNDGKAERGGPLLPCKLHEKLPAWCDVVLRTSVDTGKRFGFKGIYRCSVEDGSWVTKDRHHKTPDKAPMNLGELFRHIGYTVRRHPALAWQEEVVAAGAAGLAEVKPEAYGPVLQQIKDHIVGELNVADHRHINWTLRDALDRATIKRMSEAKMFSSYGVK